MSPEHAVAVVLKSLVVAVGIAGTTAISSTPPTADFEMEMPEGTFRVTVQKLAV